MRLLYVFITCITLYGCQKQNPESMKKNLSGYWEIHNVRSKHVENKEYTFNTTVDYIEVHGDKGIRTKIQPNMDGSFSGSKTGESFELKVENGVLNMYYKTPFYEWKETVIHATDKELSLRNEDGVEYFYKKFEPINLE